MVTLTIDGVELTVPAEYTILQAAGKVGIRIPTLCHFEGLEPRANCRMCVVEVERFRTPQPACATRVSDGMVVRTDTPALREARKATLELILAHHAVDCHHCLRIGSSRCDDLDPRFCEMCFWCDCVRDGFCELQALAREYKVDMLPYAIRAGELPQDASTGCIVRDPNKCIKCRRCVDICNEAQTVHNLCVSGRGSETLIGPAFGRAMAESPCVRCGRCVDVCPTGAIHMKEHMDEVVYRAHSYGQVTAALISEDALDELGRLQKLGGPATMGQVAAGLKKIGVDYVFSDAELRGAVSARGRSALEAALARGEGAVVISNGYAAQRFAASFFPEIELTPYASEQQVFGELFRAWRAARGGGEADEKLFLYHVTNARDDAAEAFESGSVDIVLGARELHRLFLRTGVALSKIRPVELDSLGCGDDGSADPLLDPVSWGLDTEPEVLEFEEGRAAICHNLGQARKALEGVCAANRAYRVVRIA